MNLPSFAALPLLVLFAACAPSAQSKANAAEVDRLQAKCRTNIPTGTDQPAPGPLRADGRWTCTYGGGITGSSRMTLVPLADGRLSGRMVDAVGRANGVEGVMVGDEVRLHEQAADSGFKVTIDPGGRAMTGGGGTFYPEANICQPWTITCTR